MEITSTALLSVLPLFLGGMGNPAGVVAGAWLARRTGDLGQSRRIMAYIGFAGASGLLALSTMVPDPLLAMLAVGMASFSNDLVMAGAWGAAMDVGGKYAGSLSGAMNTLGNMGGALSPLAIGYILSWSGNNWNLTFYVSAAVYLMGIVCWWFLDPVTPLDRPAT